MKYDLLSWPSLSITTEQRQTLVDARSEVNEHNKQKKNTRHKDGETKQIWAHATNSCVQVNEWTWADLYIEFHLSVDLFVLCSFFIFFAFHFYFGNLFSSCCEFNYTFCGDCGLFEFCVRVRDVNNKNIEFSI